jgi:hypothetical protein
MMPTCHWRHVSCGVKKIKHPNSILQRKDLPKCGWSVVEDDAHCWNNRNCSKVASNNCHAPDTEGERQLALRHPNTAFPTMVVTHDRRNFMSGGKFHCFPVQYGNGCRCTCDKHPPCCSRQNKLATNPTMVGNEYADGSVATLQDCCNLCTNHPMCSAWEYSVQADGSRVCVLKHGAPHFVNTPAGAGATTWAGLPSGSQQRRSSAGNLRCASSKIYDVGGNLADQVNEVV